MPNYDFMQLRRCASAHSLMEPVLGERCPLQVLSIVRGRTLMNSHEEREPSCKAPNAMRIGNNGELGGCRIVLNLVAFDLTRDPHHAMVFAIGVQLDRAVIQEPIRDGA